MNESSDNFSLYKGKGLQRKHYKTDGKKTFVFDLDETIGSFSDLYILFKCIENIQKESELSLYDSDEILLFCLLDEFPEFFRYGISVLFKYLNDKKKLFSDINVYIYTNNICIPITWTSIIIKYIEKSLNIELFDNIIRCFKINDEIIEYKRTTNDKTYSDLIRCIKLKKETELCFIDNSLFPKMLHRHVYYLRPKPYYHYVNKIDILTRFLKSNIGVHINERLQLSENEFFEILKKWYVENGYSFDTFIKPQQELDVDIEVSKKLLYHCRRFFYITTKKLHTRKKTTHINCNKTRKIKL